MSVRPVPLSVLDLVPISSGSTAAAAVANTVDLARRAEEFGYHRYWIAEHHLAPGVAGSQPALVITLVAGATRRIRVGSGAVQLGHQTALSVVEQFGLVDALHPGRIDLGLGRSGHRKPPSNGARPPTPRAAQAEARRVGTLLIPRPFNPVGLLDSPRFRLHQELLFPPGAEPRDYAAQVDDIRALLAGDYRSPRKPGRARRARRGRGGAAVDPGQQRRRERPGGRRARAALHRQLPRQPRHRAGDGGRLPGGVPPLGRSRPAARAGLGRRGGGAGRPHRARAGRRLRPLGAEHSRRRRRAPVPGPPARSAKNRGRKPAGRWSPTASTPSSSAPRSGSRGPLRELRDATEADELLVTSITHDHRDRVRSYELLASAWAELGG